MGDDAARRRARLEEETERCDAASLVQEEGGGITVPRNRRLRFDHAALRAAWRAAGMRTGWTSRSSLMSLAILVDICAMVGRASGSNAWQSRMRSWHGGEVW